jgi:hypothetical protein
MGTRVLDCCYASSASECRASSIDSAVEGCARGISFSRIEASSETLDRHLEGLDGVSHLAFGMHRYYHVVDMRMQLTNKSMHMRNL